MIVIGNADTKTLAIVRFRRSIGLLVVAGMAMAGGTVFYLSRFGPLTGTLVFTAITGVFVSVVLGGGLMALGFLSASSGHDIDAAGATSSPETDDA